MELSRKPVVAGSFYAEEAAALKKQVERCFVSVHGPGKFPPEKKNKKVFGLIAPHAGYQFSGASAAHAYNVLGEGEKPDVIIIIGPAHTGLGVVASVWQGSDWETPLGLVRIDKDIGNQLKSKLYDFQIEPHLQEHSIEVQLPFLQVLYGNKLPPVLPIAISAPAEIEVCKKLGTQLVDAIRKSGKKAVIIASSDFTHYGVGYNFLPFFGPPKEVKKKLSALDFGALEKIEKLDFEGFIEYIKEKGATICGASPIAVTMFAVKELGAEKGKLLKYYTSADLTGDWNTSVSYVALVFE